MAHGFFDFFLRLSQSPMIRRTISATGTPVLRGECYHKRPAHRLPIPTQKQLRQAGSASEILWYVTLQASWDFSSGMGEFQPTWLTK
jgi:hypothetical protein